MGYSFTDLGAEGCRRSLNALFHWHSGNRDIAGEIILKDIGKIDRYQTRTNANRFQFCCVFFFYLGTMFIFHTVFFKYTCCGKFMKITHRKLTMCTLHFRFRLGLRMQFTNYSWLRPPYSPCGPKGGWVWFEWWDFHQSYIIRGSDVTKWHRTITQACYRNRRCRGRTTQPTTVSLHGRHPRPFPSFFIEG